MKTREQLPLSFSTPVGTTRMTSTGNPRPVQRILVVEDDVALSFLVERLALNINPEIRVDWVTSAEQAVPLLKSKTGNCKYDLIFADIFLDGERSGLDLWRYCQESFPSVPIVVTSAMPMEKFFAAIGRNSISPAYLPKPFLPRECFQVLKGMLSYSNPYPH